MRARVCTKVRCRLLILNRCGVPLVEVVSEPDLRSAAQAAEYMRALHQLVRTIHISTADMIDEII